jgi:hypothetical protein
VSAAAVLLKEEHTTWSNASIAQALLSTTVDLGSAGRDDEYGYGLLDVYSAIQYSPDPLSVSIDGPTEVPPSASEGCAWGPNVSGGIGYPSYEWKWDSSVVSTDEYYVPSGGLSTGTHWLSVTVTDDYSSDTDGLAVDVDYAYSCW